MTLSLVVLRDVPSPSTSRLSPKGCAPHGEIAPQSGNRRLRRKMRHDLRVLASFVECRCRHQHGDADRSPCRMKPPEADAMIGRAVVLCPDCHKLLLHACVKRLHCPMDPKPACKHCPNHCYHPTYRRQMRDVMRFSGRHMLLRGRIDFLLHLLF